MTESVHFDAAETALEQSVVASPPTIPEPTCCSAQFKFRQTALPRVLLNVSRLSR